MSDHDLTRVFDVILQGQSVEGYGGHHYPNDIDTLTNGGGRVWARRNSPLGPWTELPDKQGIVPPKFEAPNA